MFPTDSNDRYIPRQNSCIYPLFCKRAYYLKHGRRRVSVGIKTCSCWICYEWIKFQIEIQKFGPGGSRCQKLGIWLFHVFDLQRKAKKWTKIYNARAQLLFCLLNLLFDDVFRFRYRRILRKIPGCGVLSVFTNHVIKIKIVAIQWKKSRDTIDNWYINNLAKNQVSGVFHSRVNCRSVLPKFIELCTETPSLCPSKGHKHGGRKVTETSVAEFCYWNPKLLL